MKGCHYLSGKPALPPAWAFGYIQSQERYETADELISIAETYRERGIGLDCVVMDWCSWPDGQWGQKSFDETQALLQQAIAKLPDVQRTVFTLRYYDNMKYSEMSRVMNTSEGALKASYHIDVKKIHDYVLNFSND